MSAIAAFPARQAATTNRWQTLSLAPGGRTLVEASAGTGKTWTIAALYLRLLLEARHTPRQIVVATFTDAAAQELRERLRRAMRAGLALAGEGAALPADAGDDLRWLHARWADAPEVRASDRAHLALALSEFDAAPVGTLHGLCSRILAEHPFSCGVSFTPSRLVSAESMIGELAADQWRYLQQCALDDPFYASFANCVRKVDDYSLGRLRNELGACLKPDVALDTELAPVPVSDEGWSARIEAVCAADHFLAGKGCAVHLPALAAFLRNPAPVNRHALTAWEKSSVEWVKKKSQGDVEVQAVMAFAAACAPRIRHWQDTCAAREGVRFHAALQDRGRTALRERLRLRNQSTFDDLLVCVREALAALGNGGERSLADALFGAWPVALVDEFQDTDGVQYGILDAIYRDAAGNVRGRLVMIGDPKQAIYGFRGGDIHAYLRAARAVAEADVLTLSRNHRSSEEYVAAVNQLYAVAGPSLGADADAPIQYRPVEASDRQRDMPLSIGTEPCTQALEVHYLAEPAESLTACREQALRACADHITALLASGTHRIGTRVVEPRDIAVLLPTNTDILALRRLLRARRVPCVGASRASVFGTDTARELQVLLYGLVNIDRPDAVRAALVSRLWGADWAAVQRWREDPATWQAALDEFHALRTVLIDCGVLALASALTARPFIHVDWMRTSEGERMVTDLRHLAELLQAQAAEGAGMAELVGWLHERREASGGQDDEAGDVAQLRMESDEAGVQLMTLHRSKGLEFSIVYLPLMWAHKRFTHQQPELVTTTDPTSGRRTGEVSEAARRRHHEELQDERFRVLYVALTRAIHACHVFAMPDIKPPKQACDRAALHVMLGRLADVPLSTSLASRTPNIAWRRGWPEPEGALAALPAPVAVSREARPLPDVPGAPWRLRHSFSSLNRHAPAARAMEVTSADDEHDPTAGEAGASITDGPSTSHPDLTGLRAVRGTEFGVGVHAIFEHRIVGRPLVEQRGLVESALREAGVRLSKASANDFTMRLARRLDGALAAPLGLDGAAGLALGDVPASDLLAEMRFTFALERASLQQVGAACAQYGYKDLVPSGRGQLSGLLTGATDLVFRHDGRFHVLDYKGNDCGERTADYEGEALDAAMRTNGYPFQALLYTVAVDRYLRQRMPNYHRPTMLGECVYLYVRAAGLAPDVGIWRHRFPDDLVEAVSQALDGEGLREAA